MVSPDQTSTAAVGEERNTSAHRITPIQKWGVGCRAFPFLTALPLQVGIGHLIFDGAYDGRADACSRVLVPELTNRTTQNPLITP
jgi:hypothetical protein